MSKFKLQNLNKSEILKIAKRFYFSMGVDDCSSFLCRRNMYYGLAKILWAQENIGMDTNATFVASPDESITKNSTRWNNSIGYGGKLSWGDGRSKIIFLDSMPNACGMLVGTLDNLPDPKHLIDRIMGIERESYFVNDVEIEWDFGQLKSVNQLRIPFSELSENSRGLGHTNLPPLKGMEGRSHLLFIDYRGHIIPSMPFR